METKKRGRKAEFRNAAEKQKAYRARLKQQNNDSETALWLLEEVKSQYVTLLKSLEWHKQKGKRLEVRYHATEGFNHTADIYADGQFVSNKIDLMLFRYMVKIGQLIFKEKHWAGDKYIFKEFTQ